MNKYYYFLLFAAALTGCKPGKKDPDAGSEKRLSLFSLVSPDSSGIHFNNVLVESDKINPVSYPYVYNGAGVAAGDINNDGLIDLFYAANQETCRLYLNKGNFVFEDITEKAGVTTSNWCTGVTMADVNADGFLDIYVCRSGKYSSADDRANLLFINNGNMTFTEKAAEYGLNDKGFSGHSTFLDYDLDGDLDLFVINQVVDINFKILEMKAHNAMIEQYHTSTFYRNNGNHTFTDVSKAAGVQSNAFSLSATVCDLNLDGWPDIYVCNDYMMSDFVYINNHHGGFTDENRKMLRHTSYFAMGSDIADFNNDGFPDIVQGDMLPETNYRQKLLLGPNNYDRYYFMLGRGYGQQFMQNCLQLNNGNGTFSEIAAFAGVEKTDWTWAALFADFDNDGWRDIFFDNGYLRDFTNLDQVMYRSEIVRKNKGSLPDPMEVVRQIPATPTQNYMYRNNGDLTFSNESDSWGLSVKAFSNGAAYADLDNDGDLDLVINNMNSVSTVYRNNSDKQSGNNYITFNLKGPESNREGLGATVKIFSGKSMQVSYVTPVRGFSSAVDARPHFGLGKMTGIDSMQVIWPDGKIQRLGEMKSNQVVTLDYSGASNGNAVLSQSFAPSAPTCFTDISAAADIGFVHHENDFLDFKREPLLSQLYSRLGPALASADVNKDGNDDLFIGGAAGQESCIYLSDGNGNYHRSSQPAIAADREHEDVGALFFDADNDGDADLYVVSGGSEKNGYDPWYQDRLYLNDGKGLFQKSAGALPVIQSSGYCVVAGDYDGDGDLDLFRGGRISPGNYPFHPQSYLLKNDHGKFKDVTAAEAPDLTYTGMVTAAAWMDYNNDKSPDLVVTGEWMPVKIYSRKNGKFRDVTNDAGLSYTNGWWNSLAVSDIDMDGDADLVAGNLGLNTRIRTSSTNPACVYADDFDANGSTDAIICCLFSDGNVYPIYSRDEMIDQVRVLRRSIPTYEDYAHKTMEQIFTPEQLKAAHIEKAYTFLSCWFENKGNGTFEMKPLPSLAQFSTVDALLPGDFNNDGKPDLLLCGNNFNITPAQGRLDASNGLLLEGNGKGIFKPLTVNESGFFAGKDARSMVVMNKKDNQKIIVVGNNNDAVQLFRCKK
jgi:hypothetical protein